MLIIQFKVMLHFAQNKKAKSKGFTLKDSFPYRQKKQKPQIDFLRFLCYHSGVS